MYYGVFDGNNGEGTKKDRWVYLYCSVLYCKEKARKGSINFPHCYLLICCEYPIPLVSF